MNVVIIGAGAIGSYIASILSAEENNVILVDNDEKKLETVSRTMDVMIRQGSGTDWQLLDDLLDLSPELFLALTGYDEVNLVACSMAKNLGYPQTIARIRSDRYFNRTRLDFERIFNIDHLVGPELLVAHDIFKTIVTPGSVSIESFAHGAVQMRTIRVPERWRHANVKLSDLPLPDGMMVGLIRRQELGQEKEKEKEKEKNKEKGSFYRTIFPHGKDVILPDDEVTFIGETEKISQLHQLFGMTQQVIKSAVIVGGSRTAVHLTRILERQGISCRVIDKDHNRCCQLAQQLPHSVIVHHNATDLDFLMAERVSGSDVFVACTGEDEVNLMLAMLAKETGCEEVIALISDIRYTPIVKRLGITHTVSPRISAANRILSLARSEMVTSMVALYENQAEILEVKVSLDSKFVGIPISELGPQLPEDFLIAVIQNRGRIMIASGSKILSPGDTMIVITGPKHIQEFHKVF